MKLNSNNLGIAYGALANDPQIRSNADQSHSVLITVAIHYPNNKTQFLDFRRYISKTSNQLYENFKNATKGDLVYINYHPEKQAYVDKFTGKKIYPTKLIIDYITFIKSEKENNTPTVKKDDSILSDESLPFDTWQIAVNKLNKIQKLKI